VRLPPPAKMKHLDYLDDEDEEASGVDLDLDSKRGFN